MQAVANMSSGHGGGVVLQNLLGLNCVVTGCIDGTHVQVQVSPEEEETYINRHHKTSINVVAVADNKRRLTFVSVHAPGRMHDSRVLATSGLPEL